MKSITQNLTILSAITIVVLCIAAIACGNEVEIIDPSTLPVAYPAACYEMDNVEFYQWATEFNEASRAAIVHSDEPRWVEWSGYMSSHEYTLDGLVIIRESYPKKYLNPAYKPPGALRIINPFCKPTR